MARIYPRTARRRCASVLFAVPAPVAVPGLAGELGPWSGSGILGHVGGLRRRGRVRTLTGPVTVSVCVTVALVGLDREQARRLRWG